MDYKLFYLNSMMHYGTYNNNVFSDRHLSYVEYHKHKLNLSLDYSPLKCVINCIIHHPYFKIFNNNYCYAETEKIIEGGYYSIYECNKISSNELWNSFKHKNKESIIDLFNDISMDFDRMQDFYKYYPHDVISELLYRGIKFNHPDFSRDIVDNLGFSDIETVFVAIANLFGATMPTTKEVDVEGK